MKNPWDVDELIAEILRVPGICVDRSRLDPRLDAAIAIYTNTDVEYDRYGNPLFMPKDPAMANEIHILRKRLLDDDLH